MRNKTLLNELLNWLDAQNITSENIGTIRRRCFMPWDSRWNSIVRDETAKRENTKLSPSPSRKL